jgi:hypothetical protein
VKDLKITRQYYTRARPPLCNWVWGAREVIVSPCANRVLHVLHGPPSLACTRRRDRERLSMSADFNTSWRGNDR